MKADTKSRQDVDNVKQPLYATGAPQGGLLNSLSNNKKARNFRFSPSVPPQVGRSTRSDGNVCGISHIHYRRSSSVLSTVLTLNNLLVLERKPIYLYLLFSATKVQLLFSFSMLLLQNIWLCNTSKIATIVVLFIRY